MQADQKRQTAWGSCVFTQQLCKLLNYKIVITNSFLHNTKSKQYKIRELSPDRQDIIVFITVNLLRDHTMFQWWCKLS